MLKFKKAISLTLAVVMSLIVIASAMIMSGVNVASAAASSTYKNELWMLFDNENALVRGQKKHFGVYPVDFNGDSAYVPLRVACDYMSATLTVNGDSVKITTKGGTEKLLTVGSTEWTDGGVAKSLGFGPVVIDGEVYLTILSTNSVLGTKSFFHKAMGLVVLSESSMSYSTSTSSMQTQIDTLGALLFDRPSGETVFGDLASGVGYDTHPRILADQERFDELREIYLNGDDEYPEFYKAILNYALQGQTLFNTMFDIESDGSVVWASMTVKNSLRQPYYIYDQQGNRLVGVKSYTYEDENGDLVTVTPGGSELGDGYDYGGRSNVGTHTIKLKKLAFAWQMTGEQKYAEGFYLLAKELGKWEHWGEGHFLNCADGAVEFAIGFDWIYHAFDDQPQKRDELAEILYEQGLMKGYYSIKEDTSKLCQSSLMSGGWRITNRTNNWQTVCGSGMVVSALALAEYDEYRNNCMFVTETLLGTLEKCLLQYAPDGGYIESPGYWVYGTNTLFIMLAALDSSCGKAYGYYDIVGLHDSCYFAMYITDSDFACWNYHDGGVEKIKRECFYLASKAYDDPDLACLRDYMLLERGINFDILDILYFDPALSEGGSSELMLDYYNTGIETVTMRSNWESGANFAGLHVGANNVAHGDIDCGNIYLEMGGVRWIDDCGSENYNVGNYFSGGTNGARYKYYRKTLEAHSTILIHSTASNMKHGQIFNGQSSNYAKIDTFKSEDNGAIAISNMKVQYGSTCSSAYRGLMMTNSRNTVVVQDDITFSSPTSLTAIYAVNYLYEISDDGRTAYARIYLDSEPLVLRLSLISEDETLRFETTKGNETILSTTVTKANSGNELASDPEKRLVIRANSVSEYHVAVVMELIKHEDEVVGYTYTNMENWATVSDEWVKEANKDVAYPETVVKPKYGLSNFVSAIAKLEKATTLKERSEIIERTMICLTDYDKENARIQEKVDEFLAYVDAYNEEVALLNAAFEAMFFGWIPGATPFGL